MLFVAGYDVPQRIVLAATPSLRQTPSLVKGMIHVARPTVGFGVTIDRESVFGGGTWKERLRVLIQDAAL